MRRSLLTALLFISLGAGLSYAQSYGVKRKIAKPREYGNVVINNFADSTEFV